jgi:Tfp pilus assembly protein PilO
MRKVFIVMFLLIIAVGLYYYFAIFSNNDQKQPLELEKATVEVFDQTESQNQIKENDLDMKLQKMEARYADLKELRKKMKMRLSRLSSRLRRSEFPPEQARTISQDMRRASYLLKNPKLLGAFSDIKEIEDEIEQLSDISVKLDEIKRLLDEKRKNKS